MAFSRSENNWVTSTELSGVGEGSPAARALAVVPVDQGRERGRLREGHDRLERQRGAVGVVAVGDAPDRVAQNLYRRLGQLLIVVRRARLAKVLQLPGLVHARLDVRPRPDAGESAQLLEVGVGARSPAQEDGSVRTGVLRQDALEMRMY